MIFTEKCYLIVINNIFIEYDELEKNITKIESEIPCLYEKLKSLSESLAEITNEYIRNSADPLRSNELHQKFRNSSMVYAEIT
ncbi:unnamed protein product [Schistosoma intercalatum]|nr:unnamed protein product [Schistosoma intercalatum]